MVQGGEVGAQPSMYEHYVLATAWQPQLSFEACPAGSHPNFALVAATNLLPPDSQALSGLSLHGLWPEYTPSEHGPYTWPEFCVNHGFNFSACASAAVTDSRCSRISSAAAGSFNVSGRWQQWALGYAWSNMAAHEWTRHGSCTPWSELESVLSAWNPTHLGDESPSPLARLKPCARLLRVVAGTFRRARQLSPPSLLALARLCCATLLQLAASMLWCAQQRCEALSSPTRVLRRCSSARPVVSSVGSGSG